MIGSLITGVFGGVVDIFKGSQELKKVKEEGRISIERAKTEGQIAKMQAQHKAETDYDVEALRQQQYSWKDEWLTLVFTLPFICSFIPGIQEYVAQGWTYIPSVEQWYPILLVGIVASTFGLRWLLNKR